MFSLNNKFASITKSTPFSLFYGRPGGLNPISVEGNTQNDKQIPNESEMEEYWKEIVEFVYPEINRMVEIRKEPIRERYDTRHKGKLNQFKKADLVMLEVPRRSKDGKRIDKLEPIWTGPFVVTKAWRDGMNYSLLELETGKQKPFKHIPTNRLKPAHHHPVEILSSHQGEKESDMEYRVEWDSGEVYWISESICPLDLLQKYYSDKGKPLPKRISERSDLPTSDEEDGDDTSSDHEEGSPHEQDSDFETANLEDDSSE